MIDDFGEPAEYKFNSYDITCSILYTDPFKDMEDGVPHGGPTSKWGVRANSPEQVIEFFIRDIRSEYKERMIWYDKKVPIRVYSHDRYNPYSISKQKPILETFPEKDFYVEKS